MQNDKEKMKEAIVIDIEKDGKYLFVKRADNVVAGGYWCPVSGRIEDGETQEEAVIREALEEVGLKVKPIKKVWECVAEHGNYLLHWWKVYLISGKPLLGSNEISDMKWVTLEEMMKLKPVFEKDLEYFKKRDV